MTWLSESKALKACYLARPEPAELAEKLLPGPGARER